MEMTYPNSQPVFTSTLFIFEKNTQLRWVFCQVVDQVESDGFTFTKQRNFQDVGVNTLIMVFLHGLIVLRRSHSDQTVVSTTNTILGLSCVVGEEVVVDFCKPKVG